MRSYVFVEIGDELHFPTTIVRIHARSFRLLVCTDSHMFANDVKKTCWFTRLPDFEAELLGACCFLLCS